MNDGTPWLLLVVSLPAASATARMRLWRAFKSLGCEPLRDGAYLLPASPDRERALEDLATDCLREGGSAWLMAVQPRNDDEAAAYRALFDRQHQYGELRASWKAAYPTLEGLDPPELTRLQRRLQREFDAVRAVDFFPGDAALEAQAAWHDFATRVQRLLAPDEPSVTQATIPRLDPAQYRGRTWATRRRLWVDRVASAWLIRRFIDPEARFKWLDKPSSRPRSALGFDFDGAAFTHVGDRVTFETLLASFGFEDDAALMRLGAMVRHLDVGGDPVPEAAGFEAVLAGARERLHDDDTLLAEMTTVLDSLYAHFGRQATKNKP